MRDLHPAFLLCGCLMLAACSGDKASAPSSSTGEDSLPQPDAAGGSVTGMPNPGTRSALPLPTDVLATSSDVPVTATTAGGEVDPNLPVSPPDTALVGSLGIPPDDAVPVPPADPPTDTPPSETQVVASPPET